MTDLTRSRRLARERALQLAYEAQMKSRDVGEILAALPVEPDPYTVTLVNAMGEHRERADELIARHARGWDLERLAVIDRLVMTLAISELLSDDPPPVAVVLDEAVALAKEFSTEDSGSFVNGVLSACVTDLH
ncbi:MAG TPA: transcription antitermination factor NusB [Acidimicrobiales bacterium]|nr:transcription antitermination factor NusB [Acidimicrobiales bacterium]